MYKVQRLAGGGGREQRAGQVPSPWRTTTMHYTVLCKPHARIASCTHNVAHNSQIEVLTCNLLRKTSGCPCRQIGQCYWSMTKRV